MSESDDFRWGRLEATLHAIDEKTQKMQDAEEEWSRNIGQLRNEVASGFAGVGREVTAIGTRLDAHIEDDHRRFAELVADIKRLEESGPPANVAKTGAVAGGGAGLVVIVNWLRDLFNQSSTGG